MVILFSKRDSKTENEITEILEKYGVTLISDRLINENCGEITAVTLYKKTEIKMSKGIAVFLEDSRRFMEQTLPINTIGICEENNVTALKILKNNNLAAIICGANHKNTISISSIGDNSLNATLQRSLIDVDGNKIEPGEYKISLSKKYTPFSVLAAASVLLLCGKNPTAF